MNVERQQAESIKSPDFDGPEGDGWNNNNESNNDESGSDQSNNIDSSTQDGSATQEGSAVQQLFAEQERGLELDPKAVNLTALLDDVVSLRGGGALPRRYRLPEYQTTIPHNTCTVGFTTEPLVNLAMYTMPRTQTQEVLANIPLWPYGDRQIAADKDFVVPLDRPRASSSWAEANTESEKLVQKFLIVWIGAVLIFSLSSLFDPGNKTSGGFFYFWQFFFGLAFVVAMKICRSTRGCSFLSITKWHLNFLWVLDQSLEKKESFDWSSLRYVILEPEFILRKPRIRFQFYGGTSMFIPLESFPSRDRWKSFVELASDLAPQAEFDATIGEALMPDARDASYTELWLEALATVPKRERLLPLVESQILSNGKYAVVRELGVGGQGTAYLAARVDKKSERRKADLASGTKSDGIANATQSDGMANTTKSDGAVDSDTEADFIVLKEYMLPVYVDMKARKQALERFESEARMLSRLRHDSIVKLLDFFVEDHRAYLVLEYIRGDSLRARIEKNGPVSEEEAINLGLGMCDILQYLQEQSPPVVHRDFTPDNLLQGGTERVKLIDFMVAQEGENNSMTSAVVGKQCYMPPEQFRGKAGVSSDVYACGATLYFLLTGEDPEALSPSLVHLKRQDVSIELAETITKATALEQSERFANATELRAALSTCTLSARSKADPLTFDDPQDASSEPSSE